MQGAAESRSGEIIKLFPDSLKLQKYILQEKYNESNRNYRRARAANYRVLQK